MTVTIQVPDYEALYRRLSKPNLCVILLEDQIRHFNEEGQIDSALDVGIRAKSDGRQYSLAGNIEAPRNRPELLTSIQKAVSEKYSVSYDADFENAFRIDFNKELPKNLDLRLMLIQRLYGPQNQLQVLYLDFNVFILGGDGLLQSTPPRELSGVDTLKRDFGYFADVMGDAINKTTGLLCNAAGVPEPEQTLEIIV